MLSKINVRDRLRRPSKCHIEIKPGPQGRYRGLRHRETEGEFILLMGIEQLRRGRKVLRYVDSILNYVPEIRRWVQSYRI